MAFTLFQNLRQLIQWSLPRHRHRHRQWQWHRLTNFVFKICLSSLAAIKLVALCTAWLWATLNIVPVSSHSTCLSKTPNHNELHSSAPSFSHNSALLFRIVIQIDPLNFLVLRTVCHAAEHSLYFRTCSALMYINVCNDTHTSFYFYFYFLGQHSV
jgi:hypothetical protein